jgi:selenocysteine-specific elongation factor
MRHSVIGTAGHIDHGKTTLVRALTGMDTDRLAEEKRRGISIDLGYAHLSLTDGLVAGFIDVPGHERFIKNMLAGVGGIDAVLLVVSGEEGVKPQTEEHFAICRLLGIGRGVVAITKCDLASEERIAAVRREVAELVEGSFLEGAPMVAVSAVSGAGMPLLREALGRVAEEGGGRDAGGIGRLPVDRAFSAKGFGTVVTGTLQGGVLEEGSEVWAHPLGRGLRVRGLQVYGERSREARAGQRVAVNLAGAEPDEVGRGTVLTEAGRLQASAEVLIEVEWLPGVEARSGMEVMVYAGTAEVGARLRTIPGGFAVARLREPLMVIPEDRVILRQPSPAVTLGGGRVLDLRPPRLGQAAASVRAKALASGTVEDRVRLWAGETRYGMPGGELGLRLGMREVPGAGLLRMAGGWRMNQDQAGAVVRAAREALKGYHAAHPLKAGMPKEELRGAAMAGGPSAVFWQLAGAAKDLVVEGDAVRLTGHQVRLESEEERAVAGMERAFEKAGYAAPGVGEVLAGTGLEAGRARALLQILLKSRKVVKISDDLMLHQTALQELKRLMAARKGVRFGVGEFKDWTGVTRKYAIPLLEWLDRERVTRRDGNDRVVL